MEKKKAEEKFEHYSQEKIEKLQSKLGPSTWVLLHTMAASKKFEKLLKLRISKETYTNSREKYEGFL